MIECPGCGKRYRFEAAEKARRVRCKACQEVFVVPAAGALEPEED